MNYSLLSFIVANGIGYEQLRGLARNFESTYQTENSCGFSEVGANKQLLIAILSLSYLYFSRFLISTI
jgi:hypothetical protein